MVSEEILIRTYVALVKAGKRALEENEQGIPLVPEHLREKVRQALENEGG